MLQFRRTFENEKVQLQELNRRLSHYLSRVKHLEQENACLVKEISAVRNERTFEWEDQYLAELRELRRTVDLLAFEKSKAEVERERLRREFQTVQSLLFEESGMCRDIDGELKACKVQLQQAQAKNADLEDFMIQLENESRLLEEEHRREISHVQNNIYSRALSNVTQTYRAVPPITVEEVEQYALSMSDNCMEMFEVYRKRVEDLEESVRADEAKVEDLRREKNQYAADFEKLRSELEEQKRLQVHLEGQLRNTQDKCKGELEHYQMAVEDLEQERMILTSAITDKLKEHQDLMQVKMGLSLELAAYRALLEGEQRDAYLSAGQYSREAPRRIGSSIVRQDRRPPVNIGFETRCMEQGRSSRTSPGVSRFRSYEGPVATLGRASSRRDVMSCSKTPQVSTIAVRPVLQKYDLKTEIAEEVMVQKKDVSQHSANHQKFIKDFSPLPSPTSDKREIDLKEAHKTCVRVVSPPMMSLMTMSEKEGEEDAGDIKADKSEDRKEADYSVTLEQGKIDEEEEVDAPTIEEVMITTQGEFSDDSQIKEEKESKRVDSAEEKEEGGGSQKEEVTAITQDDFSDDSQINEEKESKRIDPAEEKEEEGGSQKEEVTEITQDDFSNDSQINEEKESKRIDPAEEKEEEGGSQKEEVTEITQDDFSNDSEINEEKESKGIDPAEEKEEEGGSQKEEVTAIIQDDFSDDSEIKEEKESKRIDPAEGKTMATVSLEEIIEKVIKPAGLDAHLSSSPDSKITYHVEKTEAENGTTQIILESKIEEDLDVSDEALEELLNKEVKKVTLEDVKGTAAGSMIENLLSFGLAKGEDLEKLSVNVEIIEEPLEAHSKEDSKVTPTTVFFQSSSKFIQIEELENDPPPPEHYDSGVEELKTSVIAEEYGRVEVQEGLKDTDVTYYSQETEYYVSTPDDDPEEGPLSSSEHCEAVHGLSDETCHQKGPVISQEDSDSQESESKVTYMISELASSEDRDSLCVVEREVQVSPQMQEAMLDVLQEDSEDPKQQLRELLEELQGEVSGELKENVSLIPRNDEEGDGGLSVDIRKVQKDSDENSMTVVAEINVSQTLEGSELLQEQDKDTFEERERSVNVDGSPEEHDRVSRSEECSTPQIDVNNVKIGAPRPQADRSEEISQEGDMKTWQEYTAECAEIIQVLQSKEAPPQLKVNQEETIVYLESREEA
ncbi:synemin-like isoform X24 [Brienomyrus brachyistius]|uniref:synemin-like isoform X24 n=1 Tax=Brienomyrus brachyistius TaxID=42636 RepID=UPI0020B26CCD|nr:synemin-like isoform X24 [Brienomyrus brachyistius]